MTTPQRLLEQLEALERGVTGPPADTREQVWRAMETRLASGPAPPELDAGPLLESAGSAASSSVVLKVVGGLVIAGLVGGGLALLLAQRGDSPAPAASVEAPSAVAAEPEAELPPGPPDLPELPDLPDLPDLPESVATTGELIEPDSPAPAGPSKPPKATPKPAPKPKLPEPKPKSLADEVALMQALSTALKQGHSTTVLKLVAEHEREFGNGQFIEERRAAKARGLCQSGKLAAGKQAAASFATRWPKSIHLQAVQQDCGLE